MNDAANRFMFRAWYKPDQIMIDWSTLKQTAWNNEKGGLMYYFFTEWQYSDDYVTMQSTGLKDKNGKVIFEGDIIKLNVGTDDLICPIVWDDDASEFSLLHPKGYHCRYGFQKRIIECCSVFEIIGNIHKNPGLLEV